MFLICKNLVSPAPGCFIADVFFFLVIVLLQSWLALSCPFSATLNGSFLYSLCSTKFAICHTAWAVWDLPVSSLCASYIFILILSWNSQFKHSFLYLCRLLHDNEVVTVLSKSLVLVRPILTLKWHQSTVVDCFLEASIVIWVLKRVT